MNIALDNGDYVTVTLPNDRVVVLHVLHGTLQVLPRLHTRNGNDETVTKIDLMPVIVNFTRHERLFLHLVCIALNQEEDDVMRVNWRNLYINGDLPSLFTMKDRDRLLNMLESHFGFTFPDRTYAHAQLTLGGLFFLVKSQMGEKE